MGAKFVKKALLKGYFRLNLSFQFWFLKKKCQRPKDPPLWVSAKICKILPLSITWVFCRACKTPSLWVQIFLKQGLFGGTSAETRSTEEPPPPGYRGQILKRKLNVTCWSDLTSQTGELLYYRSPKYGTFILHTSLFGFHYIPINLHRFYIQFYTKLIILPLSLASKKRLIFQNANSFVRASSCWRFTPERTWRWKSCRLSRDYLTWRRQAHSGCMNVCFTVKCVQKNFSNQLSMWESPTKKLSIIWACFLAVLRRGGGHWPQVG